MQPNEMTTDQIVAELLAEQHGSLSQEEYAVFNQLTEDQEQQ